MLLLGGLHVERCKLERNPKVQGISKLHAMVLPKTYKIGLVHTMTSIEDRLKFNLSETHLYSWTKSILERVMMEDKVYKIISITAYSTLKLQITH